ncbi:acyl carrier protein [Streptomyces sp. NPDC060000]|uniref:acyl carrier protein n=1 Tax=Streptomyces sp. NPDC060000 TaxID=3347031 RepID=UPI0036B9702C
MTETTPIAGRVARIFREELHIDVPGRDTELIEAGLLDSVGFLHLFAALEKTFGIGVTAGDLDRDRFRSVNAIADFVAAKLSADTVTATPRT